MFVQIPSRLKPLVPVSRDLLYTNVRPKKTNSPLNHAAFNLFLKV